MASKTTVELDTLQEETKPAMKWTKVEREMFPYTHSRPLPHAVGQRALDYIAVLTKQYPFQIRYAMAIPLWKRFAQEWCDTGNEVASIAKI